MSAQELMPSFAADVTGVYAVHSPLCEPARIRLHALLGVTFPSIQNTLQKLNQQHPPLIMLRS